MGFLTDVSVEIRKLKEDRRTLRKFGITIAAALTVIGGLVFLFGRHPERPYWLWGFAACFLFFGFFLPKLLRPLHKIWMGIAIVMGWFVSRVILSILFFLVITPITVFMKLTGKDLLRTQISKEAESYWLRRSAGEIDRQKYEKLY